MAKPQDHRAPKSAHKSQTPPPAEDQTIHEVSVDSQADESLVDATIASQLPNQDDDGATLADPSLSAVSESDHTLVDPSLAQHESSDSTPEATLFDAKLASKSAYQDQEGTLLDGTLAPPPDEGTIVAAPTAPLDQTLVTSAPHDAVEVTLADAKLSGSDEGQGTLADSQLVAPGFDREAADHDATFFQDESQDDHTAVAKASVDPEGTVIQSLVTDSAGTQLQSEIDNDISREQTMVESQSASGKGSSDPEATFITDESKPAKAPKKPKQPGAHETADRWEAEQRYALVTNFARGGLGQIWMATDNRLRREVAYKEMLPKALKNRDALERFLEEAQITGQLEHPCIMPIYDIGYQPNGAPYYSMKLVRGETLEKVIGQFHELPKDHPDRPVQFRRLLKSFLDVCNALAFAHDRGVLHRDLKPLNIMIGAFGETIVLDWGLAKVMGTSRINDDMSPVTTSTASLSPEGETINQTQSASQVTNTTQGGASLSGKTQSGGTLSSTKRLVMTDVRSAGTETMMGSIMGTPSYMPPEQASGKLDELDPRSDIYSLGGILYKLLTNQQPIEKGAIAEVLKRVRENIIIPPRQHDPTIHPALEAIALKSLAKKREDRHATALLLAADVEAWMADEPVSCYADPWQVKFRRWRKRHQTAVTSTIVGASILFFVFIGATVLQRMEINRLHSVAATAIASADSDVKKGDFNAAKQALSEAIAKLADEPSVEEISKSLAAQLELVESQRVDRLRREIELKLESADSQIADDKLELARTTLTEQRTRLIAESKLNELAQQVARRLKTVEASLTEKDAIQQTAQRFSDFREAVDVVRARGSLQDPDDRDSDAKEALAAGQQALKLFNLDQAMPLAQPPQYFAADFPWVRQFFAKNNRWPMDVLREEAFEVCLMLAEMEFVQAQSDEAHAVQDAAKRSLAWLDKAESFGIKTQALHGRRAQYFEVLDRRDDFAKSMATAQATTPHLALDHYLLGESQRKIGHYANALTFYLKAQRVDPNHYWVQHFTGLCYLQLNQPAAAVSCFSSCVAMRPNYAWSYMLRGAAYSKLKDFESANADLEVAQRLAPNLFNVYVNRGAVFSAQLKYDEALKDFTKAAELAPESNLPLINMAVIYLAKADQLAQNNELSEIDRIAEESKLADSALQALNRAAQHAKSPSSPGVYALRAKVYLKLENVAAAFQDFETHIRLEQNPEAKSQSYKRMANIHSLRRDFDKSVESLTAALKLSPSDPETVYRLGEAHLQLRDFESALKFYEQFQRMMNVTIAERVPDADELYSGMATAYNALGKKTQAVEFYTLTLLLRPEQAASRSKRAWAYLVDNTKLAVPEFEQAAKDNPDDPDTHIGLAYAYVQAGNLNEVQRITNRAVELARQQVKLPTVGAKGWVLFHNASTVYAQLFDKVRNNAQLPAEQKDRIVALAVNLLTEAIQVSATDAAQQRLALMSIATDPALNPIRQHLTFIDFTKKLGGEK